VVNGVIGRKAENQEEQEEDIYIYRVVQKKPHSDSFLDIM